MKIKTKKMSKKILAGAFALSLAFPLGSLASNNAKALEPKSKYDHYATVGHLPELSKPVRTDDGWWHLPHSANLGLFNELEQADYDLFNCYISEIENAHLLNIEIPENIKSYKRAIALYEEAKRTATLEDLGNGEKAVRSIEWGWIDESKYNRFKKWLKETGEDIPKIEYKLKERPAIKNYEAKYRVAAKNVIDKLEYLTANQKEEAKRKIDNVESKIVNGKSADIRFECEDIMKAAKQLNDKNKAEGKKPEVNNSNVTTETKASWQSNSTGWWYQNADGTYPANEWKQINGEWYWFDESGYMQIAWQSVAGTWYYFTESGAMAHDTWIDGTYYVASNGAMLTNTTTPDGYTVGSDGAWVQNTGSWQSNSTGWWYQNADGSYPVNAWQQINGSWYYFNESGYMVASIWIGNYYLGENGAMVTNTTTPDGYVVGSDGAWIA